MAWKVPACILSCLALYVAKQHHHRLCSFFKGLKAGAYLAHADEGSTVIVKGFTCENGYGRDLNQKYVFQGTTRDGRPYYQGLERSDRYIYYDKYCADDTRESRWLLGGKPNVNLEFSLNPQFNGGCENDFAIVSDSMDIPTGQQRLSWQWCGNHGVPNAAWVSIDRIDPASQDKQVDTKDCYFDKECHAKVNWAEIGEMKQGFFARLKVLKQKGDKQTVKMLMAQTHSIFMKAGMPEDRIDYILLKWVKFVYPEALQPAGTDEAVCSKYAALGDMAVQGCHSCGHYYTGRVDECMGCGKTCSGICPAGDFACYKGEEFVSCHKKCMEVDEVDKQVDTKDCYFDKECHAKVNWAEIGEMKQGFFARLKVLKQKGDKQTVKMLMAQTHSIFMKAGMPEDRIDYILLKWVKFVYPEALQPAGTDEAGQTTVQV